MFRYVREKSKKGSVSASRENVKRKGFYCKLNLATNLENHRRVGALIREVQKNITDCHLDSSTSV